ncbi:thioesterase II family protein [Streptomyces olivaceoviridis]|uniref:thioesterase II family protein n=1 Tax=Streptomyces olivaceoviridis TaxID=1921 RepID=UPI0036C4A025
MGLVLPALRADYVAVANCTCLDDRAIRCPPTVLMGDADPRTTPAEVGGWKKHTKNSFRLRLWPGGLFFLDGQEAPLDAEIRETLAVVGRSQAETRAGRTLGGHCWGENTPSQ